ncbi:MAG TPA: hypothetical protein PLV87_01615 [Opitutaceae bacterium]|nr:hypothetical protein [Opitutaceae bacterium]
MITDIEIGEFCFAAGGFDQSEGFPVGGGVAVDDPDLGALAGEKKSDAWQLPEPTPVTRAIFLSRLNM